MLEADHGKLLEEADPLVVHFWVQQTTQWSTPLSSGPLMSPLLLVAADSACELALYSAYTVGFEIILTIYTTVKLINK